MKKKPKRIPRASGLTMMVRYYNTLDNEKQKETQLQRIKDHIINQYIKEGFRMNGRTMDLSELAQWLQMSMRQLMRKINRYGDIIGKNDELAKAIKTFALGGAMGTRSLVLAQAQMLTASQAGRYVPYLSSEVNRSLTNLIASDNTFLQLLKAVSPQGPNQPNVVINNQQATLNTPGNTEQVININQAVKLIDEQREATLLESPDEQQRLLAQHIDSTVPEVIATEQQGYNAKDDGTFLPSKKKKVPHEDRRELDGDIHNPEIIK